jgi:polyisoprenoid-binding protein YceI
MAWDFDPAHTTIGFSAKHMMVTTVRGKFTKYSGELDLNEQHPEQSKVSVTIETASLTTGQEQRDGHLRSPDFFDVANYPTITFKSTRVEKKGEDRYQLFGDLTIRGVTREVPLDVTVEGHGKTPYGKHVAGFTITGTITRKDFGLNWNVALETGGWLVSEQVKLEIEVEVAETVPATAQAAANS